MNGQVTDGTVTVIITSYAIEQLGDIVHIELPEEGDEFESKILWNNRIYKTYSDYTCQAGKVLEVNTDL